MGVSFLRGFFDCSSSWFSAQKPSSSSRVTFWSGTQKIIIPKRIKTEIIIKAHINGTGFCLEDTHNLLRINLTMNSFLRHLLIFSFQHQLHPACFQKRPFDASEQVLDTQVKIISDTVKKKLQGRLLV